MSTTDHCGACGKALVELPTGGRAACCPDAAMYWSPHKPLTRDVHAFGRMTGLYPDVQTQWTDEFGVTRTHAPFYFYQSPTGGFR